MTRLSGLPSFSAINSSSIVVTASKDSRFLASSAARRTRAFAPTDCARSTPCSRENSAQICSNSNWSRSSPPNCVSPWLARISTTPFSIWATDTSNVPPPRSYTESRSISGGCGLYVSTAAVGSLMIRTTSKPASSPAWRVACRCPSLKKAGTVITTFEIVVPSAFSARCLSVFKMIAEISWGEYFWSPRVTVTSWPIFRLIDRTVRSGARTY